MRTLAFSGQKTMLGNSENESKTCHMRDNSSDNSGYGCGTWPATITGYQFVAFVILDCQLVAFIIIIVNDKIKAAYVNKTARTPYN